MIPEKWIPVFGKGSCSTKNLERDDDSKRSHRDLARGEINLAVTEVIQRILVRENTNMSLSSHFRPNRPLPTTQWRDIMDRFCSPHGSTIV
jgi:hypothetical protein